MNEQSTEQNETTVLFAGRDPEAAGGQWAVQERVAHLQQGQELRRVCRHRHREAGVDGAHQEGQKQFLARDFSVLFEQQLLPLNAKMHSKLSINCIASSFIIKFFSSNSISISSQLLHRQLLDASYLVACLGPAVAVVITTRAVAMYDVDVVAVYWC